MSTLGVEGMGKILPCPQGTSVEHYLCAENLCFGILPVFVNEGLPRKLVM